VILYQLACICGHSFEAWFKDSASADRQLTRGLADCPRCGGHDVAKAVMAPRLGRGVASQELADAGGDKGQAGKNHLAMAPMPAQAAQLRRKLQDLRKEIEASCDYVGADFAEEARKIHYGEAETRGIYGEASEEEHAALEDEGIGVARIPWVPRDDA